MNSLRYFMNVSVVCCILLIVSCNKPSEGEKTSSVEATATVTPEPTMFTEFQKADETKDGYLDMRNWNFSANTLVSDSFLNSIQDKQPSRTKLQLQRPPMAKDWVALEKSLPAPDAQATYSLTGTIENPWQDLTASSKSLYLQIEINGKKSYELNLATDKQPVKFSIDKIVPVDGLIDVKATLSSSASFGKESWMRVSMTGLYQWKLTKD